MAIKVEYIFQIKRSRSKKQRWYYRCVASNGKIRFHSETYCNKSHALNSVREIVKKFKPGNTRVDDSWREYRKVKK